METNLPLDLLHWSLAIFPMALLLVLLVFYRWKAAEAGAIGVLCVLLTAALAFKAPLNDVAVAGAKGAWDSIYILYVIWPAMILYLDNHASFGPNSRVGRRRGRGLNENLAREVLELHTVGVHGANLLVQRHLFGCAADQIGAAAGVVDHEKRCRG